MKKRNVKIIYQYDGSKFLGFQRQKHSNVKTVQGEIEKVIRAFLNVLQGAYHERIKYPKLDENSEKRVK